MLSRRDFLTTLATSAAVMGGMRTAAHGTALLPQPFSLEQILDQPPFGQVTLLHLPDLHAQLTPLYLREPPSPSLSRAALAALGIAADSPAAYALSPESFDEFAARYGHVGGVAHLASVLFALRAQPETETIPVVALSANILPEDIHTALSAGFSAYLTKPLQIDSALASIDNALINSKIII